MNAHQQHKKTDGAPILSPLNVGTGNASIQSEQENKYPYQCRSCVKQFSAFRCEGHPDDGVTFACGLMVEAMRAGDRYGGCVHRISRSKLPYNLVIVEDTAEVKV
ncbi:hypothetical protein [Methanoregula sp.]|uniref:hypothetical protein n=1 Tax=Methanoregula sp. TaxID=2052170 RepID=UPI003C45CCE8